MYQTIQILSLKKCVIHALKVAEGGGHSLKEVGVLCQI